MSLCSSWRSATPLPPPTRCVHNSCHAHPHGTNPWHVTGQGFVFLTQEEQLTGSGFGHQQLWQNRELTKHFL